MVRSSLQVGKTHGSHSRHFFAPTQKLLAELFERIEGQVHHQNWKWDSEKYQYLITNALLYTQVYKKSDEKGRYSYKSYQDSIIMNDLFRLLYQPLEGDTTQHPSPLHREIWLFFQQYTASVEELRKQVEILPPNMLPHTQLQHYEDIRQTVQWLKKQRQLFSHIRKSKPKIFQLLHT